MELKEISMQEAEWYDLPAGELGDGETGIWYALDDDGEYKGFMEVVVSEEDDLSMIDFFWIPDLYREKGYADLMLEMFLDQYIPETTGASLLTTFFEYTGVDGTVLAQIFSDHGFDINLRTVRECSLPFETVYEKLASKKEITYSGRLGTLETLAPEVAARVRHLEDTDISPRDVERADAEMSVAAIDESGKLEALLLVKMDEDLSEATVTDLYTNTDDITILRRLLAFAVENGKNSPRPPQIISFVAANEKLEKVMDTLFSNPPTSKMIFADAEFNLGKYVEQLNLQAKLQTADRR